MENKQKGKLQSVRTKDNQAEARASSSEPITATSTRPTENPPNETLPLQGTGYLEDSGIGRLERVISVLSERVETLTIVCATLAQRMELLTEVINRSIGVPVVISQVKPTEAKKAGAAEAADTRAEEEAETRATEAEKASAAEAAKIRAAEAEKAKAAEATKIRAAEAEKAKATKIRAAEVEKARAAEAAKIRAAEAEKARAAEAAKIRAAEAEKAKAAEVAKTQAEKEAETRKIEAGFGGYKIPKKSSKTILTTNQTLPTSAPSSSAPPTEELRPKTPSATVDIDDLDIASPDNLDFIPEKILKESKEDGKKLYLVQWEDNTISKEQYAKIMKSVLRKEIVEDRTRFLEDGSVTIEWLNSYQWEENVKGTEAVRQFKKRQAKKAKKARKVAK